MRCEVSLRARRLPGVLAWGALGRRAWAPPWGSGASLAARGSEQG